MTDMQIAEWLSLLIATNLLSFAFGVWYAGCEWIDYIKDMQDKKCSGGIDQ